DGGDPDRGGDGQPVDHDPLGGGEFPDLHTGLSGADDLDRPLPDQDQGHTDRFQGKHFAPLAAHGPGGAPDLTGKFLHGGHYWLYGTGTLFFGWLSVEVPLGHYGHGLCPWGHVPFRIVQGP